MTDDSQVRHSSSRDCTWSKIFVRMTKNINRRIFCKNYAKIRGGRNIIEKNFRNFRKKFQITRITITKQIGSFFQTKVCIFRLRNTTVINSLLKIFLLATHSSYEIINSCTKSASTAQIL